MSKLGEILSAAKGGDESALVRLNRVTRTMINFTKSGECRDMPTEAEQAIGRERGRQAERDAVRAEASKAERDALQAETEAAQGERVPKDSENAEAEAESVSGDAAARIQADGASAHGAALFGQRAYLRQRDGESRRRKVFDAQA
jgi:hypothetical protein